MSLQTTAQRGVGGWHGRLLHVDVTSGTWAHRPLSRTVRERFVGGVGLGAYLCLAEGGAEVDDAFDPRSPLVFASSPLVGTPLSTSAKMAVVARSPLTGMLCDALTSSDFAIALKRAGLDALIVTGAASALVELVIDGDGVRIEPAVAWAGLSAAECVRSGFETAAIGVAGERCVRFANVSNGGRHAGRGGLGAVMGAKQLKAISIRGDRPTILNDRPAVMRLARDLARRSQGPGTAKYRELGTLANLETFDRLNVLPRNHFSASTDDHSIPGAGSRLEQAFVRAPESKRERRSCAACGIGCEHRFRPSKAPSGSATAASSVRLEYESAWALGPLLGIDDPDQVLAAAACCDALGLDSISAGGTLALAMDLPEFDLRFGDGEQICAWLEDIAHRRGAGDRLAEGSRRLAASVGRPEAAIHVKGLELPGYDPRGLQAMAVGFAVGTRGADHNRSGAYELDFSTHADRHALSETNVAELVEIEDRAAVMDSLVLCKFLRGVFDEPETEWHELLHAVTGADIDMAGLGARICLLRKLFNQRAGWVPDDDRLPARLHDDRFPAERLARLVRQYNHERGLAAEGWVTRPCLDAHRLEDLELEPPPTAGARSHITRKRQPAFGVVQ